MIGSRANPPIIFDFSKDNRKMFIKKEEWQLLQNDLKRTLNELITARDDLALSRKELETLKESYALQIEAAERDPFFKQIRILLPDEVDGLRETATNQLISEPNGQHSHCHRVLLLVLRLLYIQDRRIDSDSIEK